VINKLLINQVYDSVISVSYNTILCMVHVRPRPNLASGNDHEVSNERVMYDNQYDESFYGGLKVKKSRDQ
jgi:hypothetical protein